MIANSGTIVALESGTYALNFEGSNQTLNLLRGSNIQGAVIVSSIFALNLNVETGLNLALTLDPASSRTYGSFGIQAPFVNVGNTVAVIDPTGLAMQADVAADLSDTILNNIYRHKLSCCVPCGDGFWAQGIGSYRKRSHGSNVVGYDNWQGGFLFGYDKNYCGGDIAFFLGASFGEAVVDERTQKADINSYVAGFAYERNVCNTFFGVASAFGYVDWDNRRYVMNNLAPGGVETAHADINGLFVSPELTIAHTCSSPWCKPVMSFTCRYAGLFLGDYREKGSTANLSVKHRQIDLLTTRFEVATPFSDSNPCFCWSVEPYLGVFGRYQVKGNRIEGVLLDQSIDFNQEGPRNLAAFLVGFRGTQSFDALNIFLNVEWSFDSASSARILGEGGFFWTY